MHARFPFALAAVLVAGCNAPPELSPTLGDDGSEGTGSDSSVDSSSDSTDTGDEGSSDDGTDDPSPEGPFGSGTRLTARFLDGGSGSIAFEDWYDEELGIACSFVSMEDGTYRCLPVAEASHMFADPACSMPVARIDTPGLAVDGLVRRTFRLTCGDRLGGYRITGTAEFENLYYTGPDGNCEMSGNQGEMFTLEPVDDTLFVGATELAPEAGVELAARRLIADDGAHQVIGLARADGSPCRAQLVEGERRCIDASAVYIREVGFADSACTEPLAMVQYSGTAVCVEEPRMAVGFEPGDACISDASLFAVEESIDVADVFVQEATCEQQAADWGLEGSRFWRVGAPMSAADLPTVELIQLGSGAARPLYEARDDEPLHYDGRSPQWVTADAEPCSIHPTVEDLQRCLPSSVSEFDPANDGTFVDDTCSTPAYLVGMGCGAAIRYVVGWDQEALARVHAIEAWDGELWERIGETCTPVERQPNVETFVAGPQLPLTTLPLVTERFDR